MNSYCVIQRGLIQILDLRETETGNKHFLFDENLREKINSIIYPTENKIITSSNDKIIRLWDNRVGRVLFKQQVTYIIYDIFEYKLYNIIYYTTFIVKRRGQQIILVKRTNYHCWS